MDWLGQPLARAGFRAIAVSHHGNNWHEPLLVEGFAELWQRPQDLTFAVNVAELTWGVSALGAAGFSAGGYTAAALLGARVDSEIISGVLDGRIQLPDRPELPSLWKAVQSRYTEAVEIRNVLHAAGADYRDSRVRAAFLVCPGAGDLVTPESLRTIDVPTELVVAPADTVTTTAEVLGTYGTHIDGATVRHLPEHCGHDTFFAHNSNRAAERASVASHAITFFKSHLGDNSGGGSSHPRTGDRSTRGGRPRGRK